MITYDWQFLIISAGTSAVLTLGAIVYFVDLSIYRRVCAYSSIFGTFLPFACSIILLIGIVIVISLTLGKMLRPKLRLIISLAIGVLLGMLLAIFGSCL